MGLCKILRQLRVLLRTLGEPLSVGGTVMEYETNEALTTSVGYDQFRSFFPVLWCHVNLKIGFDSYD